MPALRAVFIGGLVAAATLVGGGAAVAEPLPLEAATPVTTEQVAGGWCDLNPVIGLWCLVSQSA
ncbi:hypothetical protein [Nocardia sp. NPDC050406]|uniref:hypothetical protein n=1 Tax=Nocardia sp. NPDC050406 TaxID=3364318 RepID=UPI0037B08B19